MGLSDRRIDALLAKGGLSGPESDRVLEEVLARRARRPLWRRLWAQLVAGLTLATGTALILLGGSLTSTRIGTFVARGGGEAPAADLEVTCVGGSLGACPRDASLMFAVSGKTPTGFLAAWAEPVGGGERIWYFSADGETPQVESGESGTRAFTRGVRVGPEHITGSYRVHLVVSSRPLGKRELVQDRLSGIVARQEIELTIIDGSKP
jgi:hypothetical protein